MHRTTHCTGWTSSATSARRSRSHPTWAPNRDRGSCRTFVVPGTPWRRSRLRPTSPSRRARWPELPSSSPVTPDSKAPNSFDAPIEPLDRADTRPNLSRGVTRGTSVCRMKTLSPSAAESTIIAANAIQKSRVRPSTMVARPKTVTDAISAWPTRLVKGRHASTRAVSPPPNPPAPRSNPSPDPPTPSRSSAMAGNRATAPPKSTAKRSIEIAL